MNRQRLGIQATIADALSENPRWAVLSEDDRAAICRRIERGCNNACIQECDAAGINKVFTDKQYLDRYSAICARVISNLSACADALFAGEIDPHSLARMTSQELNPQANAHLYEEIAIRQQQKAQVKISRIYTCSKCRKNETTTKPFQGRCADESENLSICCIGCGHVWSI